MYVLVWYVPQSHLENTKNAVFDAGGGKRGNYERCSWECRGKGQFLPDEQASPFIGTQGVLEIVDEYRVEVIVDESHAYDVVTALLAAHPYETPAFHLLPAMDIQSS